LLVMPLRHVSSIAAFTAPEMSSLWDRLAETDTRFDGDGLSTFINDGPRASQHIPHVHAHVLGRAAAEPENPFALLARRIGLLPE
jgi:diadenosine tetraphosphate (Ap4A) HIT family hydrolase